MKAAQARRRRGVETQYSRARGRGKKREIKSILHRGEDSTKTRTYILSEKKRKDERGKLEAPNAERTKDGKRALGGME